MNEELITKLQEIRKRYCTGPCGQSHSVLQRRAEDDATLRLAATRLSATAGPKDMIDIARERWPEATDIFAAGGVRLWSAQRGIEIYAQLQMAVSANGNSVFYKSAPTLPALLAALASAEPQPATRGRGNDMSVYGYCPICGAPGEQRERRPNGNDWCESGCTYPSAKAVYAPAAPESGPTAFQAYMKWHCERCGKETRHLASKDEEATDQRDALAAEVERLTNLIERMLDGDETAKLEYMGEETL